MRISDWSSDVCSSDLCPPRFGVGRSGAGDGVKPARGATDARLAVLLSLVDSKPVRAAKAVLHPGQLRPNNSFKPNLLRYTKVMAEKACHGFGSTTQVGLTQALRSEERRVGKACVRTFTTRWSPQHYKK